ncbi:hypothetical protein C8034_v004444 [Colletotrichum sidae]|uniref:Uncharacterized protein n=1 Tax=Colletotrichum sidae TaxID=1347389 RepID=A0A4R8T887_9PEZI|nr:hypothetical protein C8034_v004444 [Colletotrichum sidae]
MVSAHYSPQGHRRFSFPFIAFGGSVAHLLHHGADPFETFKTLRYNIKDWWDMLTDIKASDIARLQSYGIRLRRDSKYGRCSNDESRAEFQRRVEEADYERVLSRTFQWGTCGRVSPKRRNSFEHHEALACSSPLDCCGWHVKRSGGFQDDPMDREAEFERDVHAEGSVESASELVESDEPFKSSTKGVSPGFFKNATRFYHHISTEQGRRQLSRFPMVRALCDGLQHAGYRAEMDDDGDIWYDCDDGDRYFDAGEVPLAESDCVRNGIDRWLSHACPICQDFEKYGLGHIHEAAERAKEQLYAYRQKVEESRRGARY